LEWRVESQIGPATPQDIAVEQAAPTLDALAVDEGPISREPSSTTVQSSVSLASSA